MEMSVEVCQGPENPFPRCSSGDYDLVYIMESIRVCITRNLWLESQFDPQIVQEHDIRN